ncbi:hypothetical protein QYM36_002283 [Artemia franciscana]|uniref:Ubiquitin-like protease family profile domain-containing protein n=1 Tax=Artemia franciscana TaxID=6661 RepID=A0AA88I9G5_ARTSF|nr:hypothetical protein QYM36_002283 [Artemia franciscana]
MVSYLVNLVTSSCVSARTIDIYSTFNLTNIDALKSYPEKPRERFSDVSHDCSVLFVPLCVNMRDVSGRERKNHFILGICDFSRRTFHLLDSLKPLNRSQGRQVLSKLTYLMDRVDKRYTELELGSCGIAPQVDSSSCGLFVVKYAQDYANGITYLGSALSVDLPSPSKYKRSKGRSTVSDQKVIELYNDDTEMANMKSVELMNKYRNELAIQVLESLLIKNRMASCYNCRENIPENMQLICKNCKAVACISESLPVLQFPNLHDLQYASNAENANKLISFVGLLLKIERLQPTASNRPTTKLTIASDDLTTVAQMMVWEKPDKKYDVSILERYAIVNANINIFRNSTNLVPSLIVPTKLISLGRHPALPQRQVIRIPNPTIVRDEEGVFINGQIVSINPNVNHGTSLRNPVDPHLNETKKYSSLSKKLQNVQKERPSSIQETRGTSLCNPVDLHVYETKKSALKSTEAAIILKTAHETAISRFKLCKNNIPSYPAAGEAAVTCVSEFAILEVIYFVKHGIPIVFYYDTKYNIGNYWVSALTFRHPDFDHKGTTPIIPIAFLLHTNRLADSHEELFMVLMKKAPSINSPQNAFVSDREKGIEAARKKIFPLIQPAHCWLHYRINAKHALQKMGAPKGDIRVVEDDILEYLPIEESTQLKNLPILLSDTDVFTFFFEDLESLLRPETWLKTEMVSYLVNLVTSSCVSARTIDIYSTFNLTNIDALKSYPEKPRERFSDVSHDCSVLFVPLCVNMRDISDRERKNHFILGICDFSRRTFYILNSLKPLNRTQGRQLLFNLKYLMDGVDKRYTELELGSCGITPQVDSSSCGLFVVKYAQDYANGITYLGSALSVYLPSPSKYKRSKGRSTVSNQKVIELYNDDTEMANMKSVELMNKYRKELAIQVLESFLIKNRMASCYNCREQIPENMQLICKNCKAVACIAESLPVLQLPNMHDLQYASNAENANKLISFVGLLLKIERLQPTASNRPTTKLTIASDDLTTVAQMMVWEKPDKKYDVSILERYAIVNANINIFRNSTNLVPSLIVPTKLISLGRHPALPQRQVIRIPNPTIVRDEAGVFINGQIVSMNPNVSI